MRKIFLYTNIFAYLVCKLYRVWTAVITKYHIFGQAMMSFDVFTFFLEYSGIGTFHVLNILNTVVKCNCFVRIRRAIFDLYCCLCWLGLSYSYDEMMEN